MTRHSPTRWPAEPYGFLRLLRLAQNGPAHPCTVASLATKADVSRAALARRFTDLVGGPPMTYSPPNACTA